ncbi:hypothetical protein BROUX41_002151 [Berkeleyomyces rouxiae]|uniref:uncharacterized protein n=1 Tax=Berkeleyomyces rouxiae TaxID=2035830 RepID=UPI003B798346
MKARTIITSGLLAHGIHAQTPASSQDEATPSLEYCTTPACQRIADQLKQNLAPNYEKLDACNNFEEMVCGGWRENHDFRDEQLTIQTLSLMNDWVVETTRQIVEGPLPASIDPASQDAKNFQKMKAVYDACMNTDTISKLGLQPLKTQLRKLESATTIKDYTVALLENDSDGLVMVGPQIDDANPDAVAIGVTAPVGLGLPSRDDFENSELVEKYRGMVQKVLGAFNPWVDEYSSARLVSLERKIALSIPTGKESHDIKKLYNSMPLSDAAKLAPKIDLEGIIKILAPQGVATNNVIVHHPQYLETLEKILGTTEEPLLKAYFQWRMIRSYSAFVEDETLRPLKEFEKEVFGIEPDTEADRWETCVSKIDLSIDGILSRFFIEKTFSSASKTYGEEMLNNIKNAFVERLNNAKWMDEFTAGRAIKKVENMRQKVGYPTASPNVADPDDLAQFYGLSVVNSDTYFDNEVSMRKMRLAMQWGALGKPLDKDEWQSSCNEVNVRYEFAGNEIVLPAGMMQFPIFDPNVPSYISYGAYGSVVGREISQAFDSNGRYYDHNGKYQDWRAMMTVFDLKEKTQCFANQYSQLVHPDVGDGKTHYVDGQRTMSQNIADAGGLLASYQAWKKLDAGAGKGAQKLPGLDFFTPEQLFFVSFGGLWCSNSRANPSQNIYGSYSPPWARIQGTVANSKDFLEAFNCPVKEPVCELW